MNFLAWFMSVTESLERIERNQKQILKNQGAGMGAVQVLQEDLDAYAGEVSAVADEIAEDIQALKDAAANNQPLPQANVDSLSASLDKLKGLDVPDTEDVDQPHPDQTLPGDLPS